MAITAVAAWGVGLLPPSGPRSMRVGDGGRLTYATGVTGAKRQQAPEADGACSHSRRTGTPSRLKCVEIMGRAPTGYAASRPQTLARMAFRPTLRCVII